MAAHTFICKLEHVIRTFLSSTAGTKLSTKTSCLQDKECVTSYSSHLRVMQHMPNTIWHFPMNTLRLTELLGLGHLSIANHLRHRAEFCSSNKDTASPTRKKAIKVLKKQRLNARR